MPCFHPQRALRSTGGVQFVSNEATLFNLRVSCGQCIGCRLNRSCQWALRCVHEASLHERNSFVTLTYNDLHFTPTLIYRHFQEFMKRARRKLGPFRFYMCGEYGARNGRAHYHALFFGLDFPDKVLISGGKNPLFQSKVLDDLWKRGYASIGSVTFESAAYIARYCTEKITGDLADRHYLLDLPFIDHETGEIYTSRVPEFNQMSRDPGIAKDWLRLFWTDVRTGKVVHNGREVPIPRYYSRYFRSSSYGDAMAISRQEEGFARRLDNTPERLVVRESIVHQRFTNLSRSL